MTYRLHDEVLFHVELRVASQDLAAARTPEAPNAEALATWGDQDFEKENYRYYLYEKARDRLLDRAIKPALHCILSVEDLQGMLDKCGTHAVIRISLERLPADEAVKAA